MTGSSKLLMIIGCSDTDVISDSILPKSLPPSDRSGDLNNQRIMLKEYLVFGIITQVIIEICVL